MAGVKELYNPILPVGEAGNGFDSGSQGAVGVLQTAFIGDVVLATPLFESARLSCPDKRVLAIVNAGCENLLENNPNIDRIIVWDKRNSGKGLRGIAHIAGILRKEKVKTLLIPHRSFRTSMAAFLSCAHKRIGFTKGGGAFLHSVQIPYPTNIHEVERNLRLAEAAGWIHNNLRPAVFPDLTDKEKIDSILCDSGKFCIIAPGSVWPTKRWPAGYYAKTGKAIVERGLNVFLSGGRDDIKLCSFIATEIPGSVDLSGKLSLRQSYELYSRSEFVLTCDSAPQHIAAASGTIVISVFGPTIRDFGFYPYTEKGVVIEESMDCRPCGIHGHIECPKGTHVCMNNVRVEYVLEVIERKLDEKNNTSEKT